jgi:hypothetical protein
VPGLCALECIRGEEAVLKGFFTQVLGAHNSQNMWRVSESKQKGRKLIVSAGKYREGSQHGSSFDCSQIHLAKSDVCRMARIV